TASFDWVIQWRESLEDGVYTVPGSLMVAAGNSRARFVGHRPGVEMRWQINRHAWLQGDFGIFYAGTFLKQAQQGRNLNYWACSAGYKF
ncbi:MAG TPA: alginate export family protein, partial [Bryobacteraceae bacterium]|nr:alginate export family protein [Bryobacteraceae bacterium]